MTSHVSMRTAVILAFMFAYVASGRIAWAEARPKLEGNSVVLDYANHVDAHVRAVFTKNRGATDALKITTTRAGASGSKLSIFIDGDQSPVFSHTLADDECVSDKNITTCSIVLKGRVAAYGRIVDGFRRGRVSRLTVETGGTMAMSETITLAGFDKMMGAIGK